MRRLNPKSPTAVEIAQRETRCGGCGKDMRAAGIVGNTDSTGKPWCGLMACLLAIRAERDRMH